MKSRKDSVGKDGRKIPLGESPRFPERENWSRRESEKSNLSNFSFRQTTDPLRSNHPIRLPIHQKSNPLFQQLANKLIIIPYHFIRWRMDGGKPPSETPPRRWRDLERLRATHPPPSHGKRMDRLEQFKVPRRPDQRRKTGVDAPSTPAIPVSPTRVFAEDGWRSADCWRKRLLTMTSLTAILS